MTVHCYSRRLLNPFRGLLQVISYDSADAMSLDGLNWEIHVRDEQLDRDLDALHITLTTDIRYGHWTLKDGLKKGALYPSDNFQRLEHICSVVYNTLLQQHNQVPFRLEDNYELWLLDDSQCPLALLDSGLSEQDIDLQQQATWHAGTACKQTFTSTMEPGLLQPGVFANAADYLEHYINDQTAEHAVAQIFQRLPDGSGLGLAGINLPDVLQARHIETCHFPRFFIRMEAVGDQLLQTLFDEYLDWQAAWLLLLPEIRADEREHWEKMARTQSLVVENLFRLYPEIIDAKQINTARVEAQMRKLQKNPDDASNSDYLELNLDPGK